jgi:hypothetical protein
LQRGTIAGAIVNSGNVLGNSLSIKAGTLINTGSLESKANVAADQTLSG